MTIAPVHCVPVAAIKAEALKWKKSYSLSLQPNLTVFSSNFGNTYALKIPYFTHKKCSSKNEENAIFFSETVAENVIKQKLEISQK